MVKIEGDGVGVGGKVRGRIDLMRKFYTVEYRKYAPFLCMLVSGKTLVRDRDISA